MADAVAAAAVKEPRLAADGAATANPNVALPADEPELTAAAGAAGVAATGATAAASGAEGVAATGTTAAAAGVADGIFVPTD